ncbi:hypothetical protein SDRG_06570 [Saprolegnia diclina VS20]|uniref:Uncharacterized protein n=1 Tax=Saprolegnia diclina (strain VS20) TaxID=1156394 RepID=T0RZI0_SAPDV|nr:hypothetical protein SDRG_06570 [Saprolegnia diclina VS20]EQC35812.1 hypothetical protein SDRG_06570 [Saprolegnia diclina VS20]|eukprot:XP_008610574.1 hypothetical protein SDRG_06570 [Saprolegnia diclina VS20]
MVITVAKAALPEDLALMSHDYEKLRPPHDARPAMAEPSKAVSPDREERLRKDRLRKRLSKEKFQNELNHLHRTAIALEYQLSAVQKKRLVDAETNARWRQRAIEEKARLRDAYATGQALYRELVSQMEKAVIFKSICGPTSDTMMFLDPRRDPWSLHTLCKDPDQQEHTLRSIALYQSCKITPELFAKLPGPRDGSYNLVLDETDQHVSYVELFKHGTFAAHHEDIARALHRYCLTAHEGKQVRCVDGTLALTVFTDKRRHYVVNLVRESDQRMILTHRTLIYDDVNGRMAHESIAGWWVCERLPSLDGHTPRSAMRCYAQACIDVNTELSVQAYTSYLVNAAKEDVGMNQALAQFHILSLT